MLLFRYLSSCQLCAPTEIEAPRLSATEESRLLQWSQWRPLVEKMAKAHLILHDVSVFQCMSARPAPKWTIMLGVVLPAPRPLEEETKPSNPFLGEAGAGKHSQSLTGKLWSKNPSPIPETVAGGAAYLSWGELSREERNPLVEQKGRSLLDLDFQYNSIWSHFKKH